MKNLNRREMLKGTAGLIAIPSLISQVQANQDPKTGRTDALDYIRSLSQKIAPILENLHSKYGYLDNFPVGDFLLSGSGESQTVYSLHSPNKSGEFSFAPNYASIQTPLIFHISTDTGDTKAEVRIYDKHFSLFLRDKDGYYPQFQSEFNLEGLTLFGAVLGPNDPKLWDRYTLEIEEHPYVAYFSPDWKKNCNGNHPQMDFCPDSLTGQAHLLGREIPWKINYHTKFIETIGRSGLPEFADTLEQRFG